MTLALPAQVNMLSEKKMLCEGSQIVTYLSFTATIWRTAQLSKKAAPFAAGSNHGKQKQKTNACNISIQYMECIDSVMYLSIKCILIDRHRTIRTMRGISRFKNI